MNKNHGFPVTMRQEVDLLLSYLKTASLHSDAEVSVTYSESRSVDYFDEGTLFAEGE